MLEGKTPDTYQPIHKVPADIEALISTDNISTTNASEIDNRHSNRTNKKTSHWQEVRPKPKSQDWECNRICKEINLMKSTYKIQVQISRG